MPTLMLQTRYPVVGGTTTDTRVINCPSFNHFRRKTVSRHGHIFLSVIYSQVCQQGQHSPLSNVSNVQGPALSRGPATNIFSTAELIKLSIPLPKLYECIGMTSVKKYVPMSTIILFAGVGTLTSALDVVSAAPYWIFLVICCCSTVKVRRGSM